MTVAELCLHLVNLIDAGYDDYPVQIMQVEEGITFADDIDVELAKKYDGERVWILPTDRHNPEWCDFNIAAAVEDIKKWKR